VVGQPASHSAVDVVAVPHTVVATWPVGTFLENIAVLDGGEFVIAVHNRRELHRATSGGEHHLWVSMPASPAGMIAHDGGVSVVGGEPGQGPHHLYRVTPTGEVHDRGPIPGTLFLNGFTPGPPGTGYAVDSIAGEVFGIDLDSGGSRRVLSDQRLQKISAEPMLPGANGIKATQDALYITNTDRALVLRAPLDSDGIPVGSVEIVAEHLRGDDLAVASDGNLLITNHIHNTVIRLDPSTGKRTAIAGPDQGMAGSTACAFGTAPGDRASLFVTTTGGIVMPLDGVVQEAKLVRLETGVTGQPVTFRSAPRR
jgi:SMP-30/Gluconolactonase/LRE-like region